MRNEKASYCSSLGSRLAHTAAATFVAHIALALPCLADVVRTSLAPGVVYTQERIAPPDGPLLINTLRIDPHAHGVRIQAQLAQDIVLADDPTQGREPVGSLAARHGAVAAINADFFPFTGDPLNIAIRDGELVSESMPFRVAMAVTADGQVRFDTLLTVGTLLAADGQIRGLDGLNRPAGKDEIIALTPAFGDRVRASASTAVVTLANGTLPLRAGQDFVATASQVVRGDPRAPLPPGTAILVGTGLGADWLRSHIRGGDSVHLRYDLVSNPLPAGPFRRDLASRAGALRGRPLKSVWTDVAEAVGGGPWLVRDGKAFVDGQAESFTEAGFIENRHPRTAAAITAGDELLLVTVDGRQESHSRGMTLTELAEYLVKQGAVQAINLDGGGSSTMAIRGLYVNSPSDGEPRAVADALLIYADGEPQSDTAESTLMPPVVVHAGEIAALALPAPTEAGGPALAPDGVWGTVEGKAFISQKGILRATSAAAGTAVYRSRGRSIRIPFTVLPGPPARIRASLTPADNNPPDRNILAIRVLDAYGNAIAGQQVHLQVTGGTAEIPNPVTGADGRVAVEIVWDVDKGRKVIVSSGTLTPATVNGKLN